jgi:hypothetical protein
MLNGGKLHCGLQNDECRMQTEAFASAEPKMYILGFCTKGVTEMDIQSALKSQYHAALKTLRDEIEKCPEAMWNDPADGFATFWRVVYHALFFTDFYSLQDQKDFMPWSRARTEAHQLGMVPWEKGRDPKPCEPYTKQDLLEYWQVCDDLIDARIGAMDLSAPQCGFPWYKMPTLEHQLVNIRHIQHHAAALSSRLRRSAGINIPWVGKG